MLEEHGVQYTGHITGKIFGNRDVPMRVLFFSISLLSHLFENVVCSLIFVFFLTYLSVLESTT